MFGGLVRLVLLRFLGARVLLAITAFGWLRKLLAGRRGKDRALATASDQRDPGLPIPPGQTAATGVDRRT